MSETCIRVRIKKGDAYGFWSQERCQTPGPDTTAPRVLVQGPARRHGRWLTLEAGVFDEVPHQARGELESLLGLSSSGALQIRVGSSQELSDEPWQPYAGSSLRIRVARSLRQATGLWIQARDGAGNLSDPQPITIQSRPETLVDRAIKLEEDAVEEVSSKKIRKRILQSIPRLKMAALASRKLPEGSEIQAPVDALVNQIVGLKVSALVRVKQNDLATARSSLEQAMLAELELALLLERFADNKALLDRSFSEDGEAE